MTTPKYSAEFKRAVVHDVLAGEKRISQICRERGIDEKTLRRWRSEYEHQGPEAWTTPASGPGSAEEKIAQLERGAPSGHGLQIRGEKDLSRRRDNEYTML